MKDESLHPPRAELFAYRDGELPSEKRVLIEAHVVGCSACRALIDEVSGIEAALKRSPHDAAADYYEKLPGAVLERLAGGAPDEDRPVHSKRGEPAIERRRSEDDPRGRESGRIGAAPRLPWAAIVSTVSAAAAVLIVVVLLVRQGAFRRAVSPPPPAVEEQETPAPAARVAAPAPAVAPAPAPVPPSKAPADPAGGGRAPAGGGRAPAGGGSEGVGTTSAYGALLQRFGLPPVWREEIGSEALSRAEPELRYLYQAGRAGSDSARVRLYLAEAARLRYVPGQDSTLYDQIVHHYRRAIRLDGPGSDVGKIAQERIGTLRP